MTHGASDTTTHTPPGRYLMFTATTTEEQARQVFVTRYGVEPECIFRMFGVGREVWCGPVPVSESEHDAA